MPQSSLYVVYFTLQNLDYYNNIVTLVFLRWGQRVFCIYINPSKKNSLHNILCHKVQSIDTQRKKKKKKNEHIQTEPMFANIKSPREKLYANSHSRFDLEMGELAISRMG